MQRTSIVTAVATGLVAAYFAASFGAAAAKILSSPIYGLEDFSIAKTVFSAGRLLDLSPNGLLLFAARLGAVKLAMEKLILPEIRHMVSQLQGR